MTLPCYEVSRKSWKPGWNTRHAKLFTQKHDCNTRTPGKIQVVPNTRRASSIKHQRVISVLHLGALIVLHLTVHLKRFGMRKKIMHHAVSSAGILFFAQRKSFEFEKHYPSRVLEISHIILVNVIKCLERMKINDGGLFSLAQGILKAISWELIIKNPMFCEGWRVKYVRHKTNKRKWFVMYIV